MYTPRGTTPVPVVLGGQQHDSDSDGHSMSGSNSTGDQPLLPRQTSPAPAPSMPTAGPSASSNEHTSPTSVASIGMSEHNVSTMGMGMGTALPAMPQPVMSQLPSRTASVSYAAPSGPPPPPPNSDKRPMFERANTTTMTQRPTSLATRSYNRPVSDTISIEKALHDESAPVSPSGRELNLSSGSPRYPNPVPMMTGRESGLNLTDTERRLGHAMSTQQSNIVDYIAPMVKDSAPPTGQPKSVEERLKVTVENARKEEAKFARKAKMTGYTLNAAIGLQVLISAMITALSAVTSGKRTQVMTSILGGAGTVVASYLARARGSNEPELSIARVKDLQKFQRDCAAFIGDHGDDRSNSKEINDRIDYLRTSLEHLLGNGDNERRLSPV